MCSLSFCRMEVHHGIRNARLQGDYSDYALTEPCPLRSTDDPSGSKDVPGRALVTWTNNRRKQAKRARRSSIEPLRARSTLYNTSSIDLMRRAESIEPHHSVPKLDRPHHVYQLDRSVQNTRSIPCAPCIIDLSRRSSHR
ncbi:unnamed protein product [Microthlaspi erraticum]|uniref:Uncharacterized protein n=1 Tax=Microthlaspi erraticum TaxID=1685480 RepID=A0A6D2KPD9_9BRAS|nr:unnamed protein product [Microthlaspi erraticum]